MGYIFQNISKSLNNIYLKKKLLILYFFCAVLPISGLSIYLLAKTQERLLTLSDYQIQADNQANRSMLLSVTSLATSISKIIASDADLSQLISTRYSNQNAVYTAYRNFTLLNDFMSNHVEITDIRLYISNPTIVSSENYYKITEDIENTSWCQALLQRHSEIMWMVNDSFSKDACLYLLRKITLPNTNHYAILSIGISNNYFTAMNHNLFQSTSLSLDDGCVFYSTDKATTGKILELKPLADLKKYTTTLYSYEGKKVLAMKSSLKAFSSPQIFYITTISYDYSRIVQALLIVVVIIMIVTLVPLFLFVTFSDSYSKRLLIVREQMHKIAQGHLDMNDYFLGIDELGELFQDMKMTITEIQQLHQQILTKQMEKDQLALRQQQTQFELLASQINPHFLFNTLEAIRMHALLANQTTLNDIIMKLGKTLRYSLDTQSTTTTLANELEHLEEYLDIQHFRFQDKLNYSIQVHPNLNLKSTILLPFLLQPIVENAIIHGFVIKKKGSTISINVLIRNNNLIISISDNGCGIPPERLDLLNKELSIYHETIATSHIGMQNVSNRIKLYYGHEYGLHIDSSVGVGTTVTIHIPHKEE